MSERSPLQITRHVWKALFLREATVRLFGTRAAWVWLLVEPLAHLAFLTFLFAVIRQREIGGIDIVPWLVIGLVGFFTFRRTAAQMSQAIDSNRALFTYRQVIPFDTVMIRGILEGLIMLATLFVAATGLWLYGWNVIPDDPLTFIVAMAGLWLLGAGLGLLVAVVAELAKEVHKIIAIIFLPLYLLSGVILPLMIVPPQYRAYLMINPIPHGLESARSAFASFYHAPPETDLAYLYLWVLGFFVAALLLYRRFTRKVFAQ
ncbi:ABC transporter permease [Sphingomicrobium clamense]|uniref:Transport permease protein n=1 Tax=Sphingomicrobium clamense TaxID=2851013 RepID=A0ABS6V330_9SPHN|nr:ABC transporter permease [Sphingomicrobium sp. B8]MBW0143969.1 ABC transporter permease [Sphingomicrobium sp. B8]